MTAGLGRVGRLVRRVGFDTAGATLAASRPGEGRAA